ncbi:MAG TPA: MFS transporter [Steroidobacteraceae bacterium]
MNTDPREILAKSPMRTLQILAVVVTIGLNALDGFDVLSISYALPGIYKEWGMKQGALGIVATMELIGMALGSLMLGGVADKIGRRRTTLGCVLVMTLGMFGATTAKGPLDLSIYRVVTGFGIGGVLAAINAIAAEFSNLKRRDLSVAIMSIGYPIGGVLGGMIVAHLFKTHSDWRVVFYFGTAVTAAFIPLTLLFVPESVHWLVRKQPPGALERINKTMMRMGHPTVSALPIISADVRRKSFSDIFAPALLPITVLVSVTYFLHVVTFYFVLKWTPFIVATVMHFPPSAAAGVLVWANVGGALGGTALGLLSTKLPLKPLTVSLLVLGSLGTVLFGNSPADLQKLSLFVAISGFFTNGAISGMYAIFARAFPTHVRASGTGVAIGIGRGGSVVAPIAAGYLFQGGISVPTVATIMACGSMLAAVVLSRLKLGPDQPEHDVDQAPVSMGQPRAA